MIDTLNPGQNVTCTVTRVPRAKAPFQTIQRLMRRDEGIRAGLRKAQSRRRRTMHSYIRGGKEWFNRQRVGKLARVKDGASWTMPFTPDLANDLRSVESYLEIKPA